jgi:hypothetical protein
MLFILPQKDCASKLRIQLSVCTLNCARLDLSQFFLSLSMQPSTYSCTNKHNACQDTSPPNPPGSTAPSGPGPPHCRGFTITPRHTTLSRTPLDEWPARRRDLYLTTHNKHKRQTSMPPMGFEPTIPASERPQTYFLDRAATGIGPGYLTLYNKWL